MKQHLLALVAGGFSGWIISVILFPIIGWYDLLVIIPWCIVLGIIIGNLDI